MWRYLIKKGYVLLIFAIGNNKKNITQLSKESGMTISHLARVLDYWEKEGLVTKHKTPEQSSEIFLTEQGKKLNMIITDIYHMANQAESKIKPEDKEWKKKSQKSRDKSDSTKEEKSSTSTTQKKEISRSTKQLSDPQSLKTEQPTTKKESGDSTKTSDRTELTSSKQSSDAKSFPEKSQQKKN